MKFDQGSCVGFVLGYFILSPLLLGLVSGNLRLIFNTCVDGIVGVGLAIAFGYFFGRNKK